MPPKTWAGKRSERFSVVEKGVGIEMQSTRNLFSFVGMDFQCKKLYIFFLHQSCYMIGKNQVTRNQFSKEIGNSVESQVASHSVQITPDLTVLVG